MKRWQKIPHCPTEIIIPFAHILTPNLPISVPKVPIISHFALCSPKGMLLSVGQWGIFCRRFIVYRSIIMIGKSNESPWSREFVSVDSWMILLIYLSKIRKLIIPIITTYSSEPNNVIAKIMSYTYSWDHGPMMIHLMYQ